MALQLKLSPDPCVNSSLGDGRAIARIHSTVTARMFPSCTAIRQMSYTLRARFCLIGVLSTTRRSVLYYHHGALDIPGATTLVVCLSTDI